MKPSIQIAPCVFLGLQQWPGQPTFALYNLTSDCGGLKCNSTVSKITLAQHHLVAPQSEIAKEQIAFLELNEKQAATKN